MIQLDVCGACACRCSSCENLAGSMAADGSKSFVDLDINRVTDNARTGFSLGEHANDSPQRHNNKAWNAAAVPPAAVTDPYGPPPLSVKPGATTSHSLGCCRSPTACVIFAAIALVMAGAALGVGLGLGLRSSSPAVGFDDGLAGNTTTMVTPQPPQQQPGGAAGAPRDEPEPLPAAPPADAATSAPVAPTADTPTPDDLSPEEEDVVTCIEACTNCALSTQQDDCPRCTSCNLGR